MRTEKEIQDAISILQWRSSLPLKELIPDWHLAYQAMLNWIVGKELPGHNVEWYLGNLAKLKSEENL